MRLSPTIMLLLLVVESPLLSGSLISSASIAATGFCPAVSQTGTSSASVVQHCEHPAGFSFDTGQASATAALGELTSSTTFSNSLVYPTGSAFSRFSAPMMVRSSDPRLLHLQFRIRFSGRVENHAESTAFASSHWEIDDAELGTFIWPPTSGVMDPRFDEVVLWTSPITVSAGQVFTLAARVNTEAQDYNGFANLNARLLEVVARGPMNEPVSATVHFVPEPVPVTLFSIGLCAIMVLRRTASSGDRPPVK